MTVEVSVILPTFNRANSLGPAISSVLTQSGVDFELIVVDDGSSEDIESVVRRLDDPRMRYIRRPKNGGAAAARNTGITNARGNYIAFQDSDDLWLPGKLEKQLALFSQLPADVGVVTGRKILYARAGRPINGLRRDSAQVAMAPPGKPIRLDEDQVGRLLGDNRLSVQCALFKRSLLPQGDWFDTSANANEDWEFAIRLVRQARLYEDPEPVVLGFVSSDSISINQRRQIIGVLRILKSNRVILQRYKRRRSELLAEVGRVLLKSGKRRQGLRFLLASVADHPASIVRLLQSVGRHAVRPLRLAQSRG